MKSFFITGTDTDSGKTYVTCQLLKFLKAKHYQVEALKPVASGCIYQNGLLQSGDAMALAEHSELSLDDINPWSFPEPVSPHIAAEKAGIELRVEELSDYCHMDRWQQLDVLLVEGAGGIAVPLNSKNSWVDFLKYRPFPSIIVVGIKLGCINHAILTESMLLQHHLPVAGWIANFGTQSNQLELAEKTLETLKNQLSSPMLGRVDFKGGFTGELFF